jgi:hypothetical protein
MNLTPAERATLVAALSVAWHAMKARAKQLEDTYSANMVQASAERTLALLDRIKEDSI